MNVAANDLMSKQQFIIKKHPKCFLRIIINEIIIIHLTKYLDGFYYCLYQMMLFYIISKNYFMKKCNLSESAQEKRRWKK